MSREMWPITHGSNTALVVVSANPDGPHKVCELVDSTGNGLRLIYMNTNDEMAYATLPPR